MRVPFGIGEMVDKRRAGEWYVGVIALPGETAEFELTTSLYTPPGWDERDHCNRFTHVCAGDSARQQEWENVGPPAPPPSEAALAAARAEERNECTSWYACAEDLGSLAYRGMMRVVPSLAVFGGATLGLVMLRNWWRRRMHRIPREPPNESLVFEHQDSRLFSRD